MLLVSVGGRRVEGLFSDIFLATVDAKLSSCVLSKVENCDKKVVPVAENTAYMFVSSLINPISVGVLSDVVRHPTSN